MVRQDWKRQMDMGLGQTDRCMVGIGHEWMGGIRIERTGWMNKITD